MSCSRRRSAVSERLDALGHRVEGASEIADFVAARCRDSGREIAAAETIDGARQLPDRPDDGERDQPAQERDGRENEDVDGHERPHVERRRREDEQAIRFRFPRR